LLYCATIQGTRSLLAATALAISPDKAGIMTRSVLPISFSSLSTCTVNSPSLSCISRLFPTNCTSNKGCLPDTARNWLTVVKR
jgi:hypothetical protein